jgi:Tfp pilus assembly protein PilP
MKCLQKNRLFKFWFLNSSAFDWVRQNGLCNLRSIFLINRRSLFIVLAIALFFCSLICFFSSTESKAEQKTTEPKKADVSQKINIGDFVYVSENKRDPFEPLYLLKMRQDKVAGVSKRGYELEELKLVGVLRSGNNRYAMMENMQGKGIYFKKGDFLNNNLWISDIIDSKVILNYKLKGETKRIEIDIPKK